MCGGRHWLTKGDSVTKTVVYGGGILHLKKKIENKIIHFYFMVFQKRNQISFLIQIFSHSFIFV